MADYYQELPEQNHHISPPSIPQNTTPGVLNHQASNIHHQSTEPTDSELVADFDLLEVTDEGDLAGRGSFVDSEDEFDVEEEAKDWFRYGTTDRSAIRLDWNAIYRELNITL